MVEIEAISLEFFEDFTPFAEAFVIFVLRVPDLFVGEAISLNFLAWAVNALSTGMYSASASLP
ncbi:MAG: hypothetical protein JSS86_23915 [Cyanobacteria bacterium SZAS LIN-2]|nr:hypothetical protein [Cyanobacteria bacterium SZAS LIN-2]